MAAYPSLASILYISPFNEQIQFKTLIGNFDNEGQEQRKQKWLYPKRNLKVGYEFLDLSDARTLWQFYINRAGSFQAFNFFYVRSDVYTYEYVGVQDGTTVIFNLPSTYSSLRSLYSDYVLLNDPTEYTFSALGGADGADKITLVAAGDAGDVLTLSFTGYLKVRCKFATDALDFQTFYQLLVNMEMPLKGMLNE